jgi:RNA polymerase sigma-70 factor (ECF subfamily)
MPTNQGLFILKPHDKFCSIKKCVTFSIPMRYKNSVKTYKTFYLQNKDKLFGYLMRLTGDYHLSSDIMQESFTRLLSRYGPHEQSVSLLFKIARNAVMDDARKNQRHWREEDSRKEKDDGRDPEKMVLVREAYRKVLAAMQQLEEMEREVLSLAVSSGLAYQDIANIVGISEGNVRVKIHRARMNLKKNLGIGDDDR